MFLHVLLPVGVVLEGVVGVIDEDELCPEPLVPEKFLVSLAAAAAAPAAGGAGATAAA